LEFDFDGFKITPWTNPEGKRELWILRHNNGICGLITTKFAIEGTQIFWDEEKPKGWTINTLLPLVPGLKDYCDRIVKNMAWS